MKLIISILTLKVALAILSVPLALASPAPGALMSLGTDTASLYRSPLGFKIDSAETAWERISPTKKSKFVITQYRAKESYKNIFASLTLRRDSLKKKQSLEDYVEKWLGQYPKFGFDVIGSKRLKSKSKDSSRENEGFLIDLVSRDGLKQLRQVVYVHDKNAFVLTCRDHKENFKKSLKDCNKIIRSFEFE
ncbi:MAG: hypothetical protein SGJ18_04860 [Pseudomonadota bacterium]|nr:hypothetical protein [Pseudomonadota bacterium]